MINRILLANATTLSADDQLTSHEPAARSHYIAIYRIMLLLDAKGDSRLSSPADVSNASSLIKTEIECSELPCSCWHSCSSPSLEPNFPSLSSYTTVYFIRLHNNIYASWFRDNICHYCHGVYYVILSLVGSSK